MQRINSDIKDNNFKQIYLLYGDERYLRLQYADKLKKALCDPEDTMNVHSFSGKDVPVGEIIDLAETMPFFADRRVIFITDSGLFKSEGEKLAEYLSEPAESVVFVFNESAVDKRSKLYKTVSGKGCAVEFTVQTEETLLRWVGGILKQENKKITRETAELFLGKTGSDMANIRSELDKLISYCGDRDTVTSKDVETICTNVLSNRMFDMIDYIAGGNLRAALDLYYDLIALKEAPMVILFNLARQCNRLLVAKEMRRKGHGNDAIAEALNLKSGYIARKYASQASGFKTEVLKSAVAKCVETEEAIKTGRISDVLGVEMLIFSVFK